MASVYPFMSVMWTMIVFFLWIMWFWLLFRVWTDVFRRNDLSGWGKSGWIIFTVVLPFLGVFVYLISESSGMAERTLERAQDEQTQFDGYVRESNGGAAAEIGRAKTLMDSGAITASEFDLIKAKALA